MTPAIITLDVREDFRSGPSPCDKIQKAISQMGADEKLRLLVPFEPVPLYEVGKSKGLGHRTQQMPSGDWEVLFFRSANDADQVVQGRVTADHSCGCGCSAGEPVEIVDVDARGLEPPQPMVKILEALASLSGGVELRARTDRRPIHLYPMLEARGFAGISEEQNDGSFITLIQRR